MHSVPTDNRSEDFNNPSGKGGGEGNIPRDILHASNRNVARMKAIQD
jgi:hypothetical protein